VCPQAREATPPGPGPAANPKWGANRNRAHLLAVAARARGHQVLPGPLAALGERHHVVHRQVGPHAAVPGATRARQTLRDTLAAESSTTWSTVRLVCTPQYLARPGRARPIGRPGRCAADKPHLIPAGRQARRARTAPPQQRAGAQWLHTATRTSAGNTTSPSAAADDDLQQSSLAPAHAARPEGARAHWQVHLSRSMMLRRDSVSRADMASRALTYMRTRSTAGMRNWSLAERT